MDPDSNHICLLDGTTGSETSTILQHFSDRRFAEGQLGASFFCSSDLQDRSNIQLIFSTLAFELACRYTEFRAVLIQILASMPNVVHESLSTQLSMLLIEPLQLTGLSTVIVIDAIDECYDDGTVSEVISLLVNHIDDMPSARFFITGRKDCLVPSEFHLLLAGAYAGPLLLYTVEMASAVSYLDGIIYCAVSQSTPSNSYNPIDVIQRLTNLGMYAHLYPTRIVDVCVSCSDHLLDVLQRNGNGLELACHICFFVLFFSCSYCFFMWVLTT